MWSIKEIKERLTEAVHSSRGKDVLLYLLFVCVAFVFWVLLSLDTEVQRDYDVPVVIENVPDSVTFVSNVPPTINIGVQAKGSQLLQYSWGHLASLKLNFNEYGNLDDGVFLMPTAKLESRVRDYFGSNVVINNVRPDSIRLTFTTMPGERLPIKINWDVTTNLEYMLSGALHADVDSVTVYSRQPVNASLNCVETERIVRKNLRDTTYVEVKLKPVAGVRIVPDRVRVCIPVEALINKKQSIRIEPLNVPDECNLLTFPSTVEINYLVPISRFNTDDPVKAYVDYGDIRPGKTYIPVHLSLLPHYMHNPSITPDSVEYIIDRDR